ncbi:MAG: DUF3866 family protein [Actinomycetota bacterium]|nr:MAG: hypothetical protein FD171_816 [Actinomycetota bacterium]MDO8949669.1 DUF3866 family protein [Actinomycetota bacterium]MDP3630084.1 DUF3866 family protein [Actinomycetota bacterium]
MRLVWATVSESAGERDGIQQLLASLDDGSTGRAIAYPALSGACAVGERVLLNTTAVDLELGTGGVHFVVARAGKGVVLDDAAAGHVIKLRYTPMQRNVLAVEEQQSPHATVMAGATTLDGVPVVCCGLHSQILPVAAAVKAVDPGLKVVYVMTDGASLPLAFSDLVAAMSRERLLDETITAGQAFGGGLEAVSLHSALLAAKHVACADVIIVSLGPGITGTATPFGHGGVAQGEAINAVAALGGLPIAPLRLSFADKRPRHRGVSHHSLVALGTIALAPAVVVVPLLLPEGADAVEAALEEAGVWRRHIRRDATDTELPDTRGIAMRSMGRTPADDPVFFLAAAAAGTEAARSAVESHTVGDGG